MWAAKTRPKRSQDASKPMGIEWHTKPSNTPPGRPGRPGPAHEPGQKPTPLKDLKLPRSLRCCADSLCTRTSRQGSGTKTVAARPLCRWSRASRSKYKSHAASDDNDKAKRFLQKHLLSGSHPSALRAMPLQSPAASPEAPAVGHLASRDLRQEGPVRK